MVKDINPDIKFRKELRELSGSDLGTCMQCGTCSVVCSLAPDDRPFPRKEMIAAAWGLKEELISNCDTWLCHQCGDCSAHCPRGVKPADVIASIRNLAYRHYARPRFMGKLLSSPAWLPVAIFIPVAIIALILTAAGTFTIPDGPVNYSKFFPHAWLNGSFSLLTLLSWAVARGGFSTFVKEMKSQFPGAKQDHRFFPALIMVFKELMVHSNFTGCKEQKNRKTAHLLVFYGFTLLLFVTLYAILAVFTGQYPLKPGNVFKVMGNIASLMLFTGLGIMVINRLTNPAKYGKSNYADWLLLISMLLLTLSGSLVQLARFGNWAIAYYLYFFHLVCVWFVIIYLPYTKFGHLVYRTLAMAFAKAIGRR